MTIEELKEKLAKKIASFDTLADPSLGEDANWEDHGEDAKKVLREDADTIIQAFLKFCKENNIYRVAEGELPKITDGTEARAAIAVWKWHKQSLKPISEVLKG